MITLHIFPLILFSSLYFNACLSKHIYFYIHSHAIPLAFLQLILCSIFFKEQVAPFFSFRLKKIKVKAILSSVPWTSYILVQL